MNLSLPLRTRLYFCLRLRGIRTVRIFIRFGVFLRWPWLVFNLMALQRRMGWEFRQ